MFDANMRYLPRGRRFFAEVYTVSEKLKSEGINTGDLILCHMLNSGHEEPCVDVLVNDKLLTISSHKNFTDNWFVYAGNQDGPGFINDKLKQKAMTQLVI